MGLLMLLALSSLFAVSCSSAEALDESTEETTADTPEEVAEDPEALVLVNPTTTTVHELQKKEIEERIHGWKASFVGQQKINGHYPRSSEEAAQHGWFVVNRKGERTGFTLDPTAHQQKGAL